MFCPVLPFQKRGGRNGSRSPCYGEVYMYRGCWLYVKCTQDVVERNVGFLGRPSYCRCFSSASGKSPEAEESQSALRNIVYRLAVGSGIRQAAPLLKQLCQRNTKAGEESCRQCFAPFPRPFLGATISAFGQAVNLHQIQLRINNPIL